METKLITICFPITKFADIVKIAFKMAAENEKLNIYISDYIADQTEIPSAKHILLWPRNAQI